MIMALVHYLYLSPYVQPHFIQIYYLSLSHTNLSVYYYIHNKLSFQYFQGYPSSLTFFIIKGFHIFLSLLIQEISISKSGIFLQPFSFPFLHGRSPFPRGVFFFKFFLKDESLAPISLLCCKHGLFSTTFPYDGDESN